MWCGKIQETKLQEFDARGLPRKSSEDPDLRCARHLDRDFEQVLDDLQRLETLRIFPRRWQRRFLQACRATLGETRAWANFEVIEVLHQTGEREWTSFGRRRRRLEELSASSDDVSGPTKSSVRKSPR
jgi:hypothetical protein